LKYTRAASEKKKLNSTISKSIKNDSWNKRNFCDAQTERHKHSLRVKDNVQGEQDGAEQGQQSFREGAKEAWEQELQESPNNNTGQSGIQSRAKEVEVLLGVEHISSQRYKYLRLSFKLPLFCVVEGVEVETQPKRQTKKSVPK
jgi:uncharacterized protein with von Willebrand factor type A (vWA) domain